MKKSVFAHLRADDPTTAEEFRQMVEKWADLHGLVYPRSRARFIAGNMRWFHATR